MFQDLSDQDLVDKVAKIERDMVALRFRHSTNQLENTASLRVLRREVARLRTEARVREAAQGLAKNELFSRLRPAAAGVSSAPQATKGGFLQGIVDRISSND